MVERKAVVAVFDLDYTLWPFWADTHVSPPFRKRADGSLVDASGRTVELCRDARLILERLKIRGVPCFAVSRTDTPNAARELLRLFDLRGFFEDVFFDRGTKTTSLRRIAERCGCALSDVVLFDDEHRNIRDATAAGARAVCVPEDTGATVEIVEAALESG